MKFGSSVLLMLVVGTLCLYQGCLARVEAIPVDVLESLKFDNDEIIVPPQVEDEIYERAVFMEPEGRSNECSITIRGGLTDPQPVFLKTDSEEFYPYTDAGVMTVDAGKTMQMWCPGKFKTHTTSTLLTATCVSGKVFKVGGTSYNFDELICNSWPGFVAKKTGGTCNGGILIKVGFEISASRFAEQMQVCFNEELEVTRYVRHTLGPASNAYQTGVDRITFQTAGFFDGKAVDKLYTQVNQKATINAELGGDADKFFDTSNMYLARGHMGAKADFVYGTQQRATFLFINAAPQWQVFNAGNWVRVEDGLRAWVGKNKMNVNCYTGVWGVTTLPNSKGVETPLYLSYDSNHNGLIPVPKIYFRVVIEPSTKRGIVLVGVNNPHLTLEQIKSDYILCPDVSDKVTYINWKREDIKAGYSYACEVSEFLKKVTHLPALTANGGLLV